MNISGNRCRPLKPPLYGWINVIYEDGVTQGSVVEFLCDDGYLLEGAPRTLCHSSFWTEPVPQCIC